MPGGSSLKLKSSDYRGEINNVVILPYFWLGIKKEALTQESAAVKGPKTLAGSANVHSPRWPGELYVDTGSGWG